MAKKKHNLFLGPILVVFIMLIIIAVLSWIFSMLGINGSQTTIISDEVKTTLVSVNNILSSDGIKYIFSNIVINFQLFEPLFLLIIALIGISVGEASGLFKAIFGPFKKIKLSIIIMITLLFGIVSNILGPSAYALFLPLAGIFYKNIGRNPIIGIITMFLALTIGQGGGLLFNSEAFTISNLTAIAANTVDKNFNFSMLSSIYISLASIIFLVFIGHYIVTKYVIPRTPRWEMSEEEKLEHENLITSSKALRISNIIFILMIIFYAYLIIPGLPGSGILLASEGSNYLERLLGADSVFNSSILIMITLIFIVCGGVYGFTSGNIKNIYEYNNSFGKSFKNISYVLVISFFMSQLLGVLNYTNLNIVFATKLIDVISITTMAGLPLIIVVFIAIILIGILIPSITLKWAVISPVIVPLMMRANMTPDYAQYLFVVANGLAKSISPFFGYFILTIALLQKYNENLNTKITIFGILKKIWPAVVLFTVIWLLIIIGWYVIGVPLGINTLPTL